MKVVYGRKRTELAALETDPDFAVLPEAVVALGSGLPEKGLAFAFRDWKEFVKFAAKTDAGEKVASMDERRRKMRKRSGENLTGLAERLKRRTERIRRATSWPIAGHESRGILREPPGRQPLAHRRRRTGARRREFHGPL